jgi:heat shock protein HslJ
VAALALATAAVVLVACGSSDGGAGHRPTSTTSAATTTPVGGLTRAVLAGRRFVSQQVTGHDLVAGTAIRLDFTADQLGASAGCNSLNGPYAVAGGKLRWTGSVSTTEIGCDAEREAQDRWLTDLLTTGAQAVLEGDDLVLRAGTTTVTLVDERVADPDRPLVGTAWELETIVDGDTASSVPAGVATPTLELTDDGRAAVFTGCNRGTATVTLAADGARATIGPLALTRMSCGDDASTVEAAVVGVLDGEVEVAIDGATLTITRGDQALGYRAR